VTSAPTIVGVATGTPDGGVAIVRLSGPQAREIAEMLCGSLGPPRRLVRRALRLGAAVEDGLVVWMPGAGSFTGEDVVELNVHAGARNVRAVVDQLLAGGAIAAEAGEFTRRAFEHGRIGLDQAEGIAALIAAQTDAGLEQARRLVAGELGQQVEALCAGIRGLRCEVEANLDFPDDVAAADVRRWRAELVVLGGALDRWIGEFEAGRRRRERTRVVLAGPPNAGKSSLFNQLLGRDRAIVSPVPGTTRDYVEAEVNLGGLEATLVDTAGLHGVVVDAIEAEGVRRSRTQIDGADLVLWVEAVDQEIGEVPAGEVICIENKRDLGCRRETWIGATASAGGIDAVLAAVARWHVGRQAQPWIGLARHRDRVVECREVLTRVADGLSEMPLEVVAFELGVAERRLAEISGRGGLGPIGEDVLRDIFSRFCIGK
jgi:tRNA modification GTPase